MVCRCRAPAVDGKPCLSTQHVAVDQETGALVVLPPRGAGPVGAGRLQGASGQSAGTHAAGPASRAVAVSAAAAKALLAELEQEESRAAAAVSAAAAAGAAASATGGGGGGGTLSSAKDEPRPVDRADNKNASCRDECAEGCRRLLAELAKHAPDP